MRAFFGLRTRHIQDGKREEEKAKFRSELRMDRVWDTITKRTRKENKIEQNKIKQRNEEPTLTG